MPEMQASFSLFRDVKECHTIPNQEPLYKFLNLLKQSSPPSFLYCGYQVFKKFFKKRKTFP